MDILTRKAIPFEEADIAVLRQALSHYSNPDDKIGEMVRRGELLRLRRGLYAVAPQYRQNPLSLEILANLIYGPSYISLEYALSWYGMIPERVSEVTSVCRGRSRIFQTPVARFSYTSIPKKAYVQGYDLIEQSDHRTFLMATREKALIDLIETQRTIRLRSLKDVERRLLEDLRMDEALLMTLDLKRFEHLANLYGSARLKLLTDFLKNMMGGSRDE